MQITTKRASEANRTLREPLVFMDRAGVRRKIRRESARAERHAAKMNLRSLDWDSDGARP